MKRHLLDSLQEWIRRKRRKPLLLHGARQVGKTWLIRELARQEKIPLTEVNFELHPAARGAFASPDPSTILHQLALIGFPVSPGGLLFFDEIQECPAAITALRYFHELQPDIPVVATGSLLEFAMDAAEFSMPVGRLESLWLHPMDFMEFLLAKEKPDLAEAISSLAPGQSLPAAAHAVALSLLRDYFFTGGMPEALCEFIDNADSTACRRAQLSILQTYRRDFAKYAPRVPADLAENLFLRTPGLIGDRLKFSRIDPDRRASSVREALNALEKAGVVRQITHSSGQGLPLAAQSNPRLVKLVFLDIGLLHAALRIDAELVSQPDLLGVHRGAAAEQFVAQELLAATPSNQEPELSFWVREALNSQAEVDFLLPVESHVIPIEVKAGSTGSLKSLHLFLESHPATPYGIRLHSAPGHTEPRLRHIPLYAARTAYTPSS
jgi:predicted AAA+ superfamily ATPase